MDCSIDATYAPRSEQLVLDALTVRVRLPLTSTDRGLAIANEVLQSFGGTGYVSFGASRGAARDGFEATVCFPDVMPWVAQNTVVLPRLLAVDDLQHWAAYMSQLGMRHQLEGRKVDVQRYQLRFRPALCTLMSTFESAVREGFRASLYAAALPVTRSARIEQVARKDGNWLEIAITRGLSRRSCSRADIAEMDTFLRAWLGFGASPIAWRVRAAGVIAPKTLVPTLPRPVAPARPARPERPALRLIVGGRTAPA